MQLDAFDRKILAALQNDGRLTNHELAEQVGLSASQCSRRRAQLESNGVIKGYRAVIDPAKIDIGLTSLISVSLNHHSDKNAQNFLQLICGLANVQDAFALTGEMDYSIKVVSRDLDDLSYFINSILLPHQSIASVKTSIVLTVLKSSTALPIL